MKYSEYGWLSENMGHWGIWDTSDAESSSKVAEDCRRLEHKWIVEEDCMDAFFMYECDGNCKKCNLQEIYLNDYFCKDSCAEYSLDLYGNYDCGWCLVGLRRGIKQIEPEEIKQKRIELEDQNLLPECGYQEYFVDNGWCSKTGRIKIIEDKECAFYHYLEKIHYFDKGDKL